MGVFYTSGQVRIYVFAGFFVLVVLVIFVRRVRFTGRRVCVSSRCGVACPAMSVLELLFPVKFAVPHPLPC